MFMAEQHHPVRRRVALKIIKAGMDSRQVVARFEAERQALAMMDHPNIARVLEAGASDSGRPYFVMELVRGVPITEYCDRNELPPRERLELFVQVCRAVQPGSLKSQWGGCEGYSPSPTVREPKPLSPWATRCGSRAIEKPQYRRGGRASRRSDQETKPSRARL